jgi:hypothetical protein
VNADPRLPWWRRRFEVGPLQYRTLFALGCLCGVLLQALVALCLQVLPFGGHWWIAVAACVLFGLGVTGLAYLVRESNGRRRTAWTPEGLAACLWLLAIIWTGPFIRDAFAASFLGGVVALGGLACLTFLPALGMFALLREARCAFSAWRIAKKRENEDQEQSR